MFSLRSKANPLDGLYPIDKYLFSFIFCGIAIAPYRSVPTTNTSRELKVMVLINAKMRVALLLAVALFAVYSAASVTPSRMFGSSANRDRRDQPFASLAVHDANFAAMSRMANRVSCESSQPPEALATPDPLVDTPVATPKITVSFIVGTDGRVHSPLILESLGPAGDRIVLDAVRAWRYRPATCNGVPTEAEGTIAFSSR